MFVMAALALAFAACTEEDITTDSPQLENGMYSLSMPLDELGMYDEETGDFLTRAYFKETSTGWSYYWEYGDSIYFYITRNGVVNFEGYARIEKTTKGTYIHYLTPMEISRGDIIYSYLCQDPELRPSTSPKAVVLEIPAEQCSDWGADKYVDTYTNITSHKEESTVPKTVTATFSLSGDFDKTSESNLTTSTPPARKLTIAVSNYNSENSYTYSLDGKTYNPLTLNESGKATIDMAFDAMSFRSTSTSATKKVYVKCNNGTTAAALTVKVTGKRSTSYYYYWNNSTRYTYQYEISKTETGSYTYETTVTETVVTYDTTYTDVTTYSERKILPLKNAMPITSAPLTVTSSMINGYTSVGGSLSYQMLGSLIEFRIFTEDTAIGKGETVQYVTFKAADGLSIAGQATHDMTKSSYLTLTNVEGSDAITSHVENCGLVIEKGSGNYVPVRMVVAPGTYDGDFEIVTDKNRYTCNMGKKTYSRAMRKPIICNLAKSYFTCTPIAEPTTYNVSSILTECSFAEIVPDAVVAGKPFTAVLVPNNQYELSEVKVTMGGVDVTEDVYADGVITIETVTGDINIIVTAIYVPKVYNVTTNLTHCSPKEAIAETVTEGEPFTTTLLPDEGYSITAVTVTMGDEPVQGAYADGVIAIEAVSGDIVITATATENYVPKTFGVTFQAPEYITITGDAAATEGESYTAAIALAEGYENLNVTVTMAGQPVTDAFVEGVVNIAVVSGDIVITATASKIPAIFQVEMNPGEGTTITGEGTATEGKTYTAAVALKEGYENLAVTVTMDGKPVEGAYADGVVTIETVMGDIVITSTATEIYVPKTFGVTFKVPAYITITGDAAATEGESYTAAVTLAEGYENLAVTVSMAGQPLTGAYANGVVNINAVTGDIVITATASKIPATFQVKMDAGEGTTITGEEKATEGKAYKAAVALKEGYENLAVTVTMDGKTVTGAFANGVVTIKTVTGDIVISANATKISSEPQTFTVKVTKDEQIEFGGAATATEGKSYQAEIYSIDNDYVLDVVTITMGGKDVTSSVYADGMINIEKVTGDITIKATAKYYPAIFAVQTTMTYVTYSGEQMAFRDEPYTATLTPYAGYELSSVVVRMGGVNITGKYYADGVINIPSVNGDIVVIAKATKISK